MSTKHSHGINRRSVIKLTGLAAGSLVLAPSMRISPAGASQNQTQTLSALNVGILAQESSIYPDATAQWVSAVRNNLQQAWNSMSLQFFVDQYNGRPSSALDHAQALISAATLQALIVLIDAHTAGELRRICAAHNLPLVVSSLGANVARAENESALFANQSLDYWQALTALGSWAANRLGTRAIAVSSFYESGYDLPFAFRIGYENAGGEIVSSHVSHRPNGSANLQSIMSAIQGAAPDVVYASYCGDDAIDFMRAYADAGLSRSIPLVASGFMVDSPLLTSLGDDATGIYSCVPWASEPFTLLGQRAAQRMVALVNASNSTGQHLSRVAYIPSFQTSQTNSAAVVPDTLKFYVRQVQAGISGSQNAVIDTLAADGSNPSITVPINDVRAQLQATTKTGWLNEYLS